MRIAVIGAGGKTGREVVRLAVARGDEVIAVARREVAPAGARSVVADIEDLATLAPALDGVDAVVCAVGSGASRAPTTVYSAGVANLRRAAGDGVGLVVISAAPAGPWREHPWLQRVLVLPILERFFGSGYADMRRMEAQLASAPGPWTVLRPPRLTDRTPRGRYQLDVDRPPRGSRSLARGDLALALLDAVGDQSLAGRMAYIAA